MKRLGEARKKHGIRRYRSPEITGFTAAPRGQCTRTDELGSRAARLENDLVTSVTKPDLVQAIGTREG